MLDKLGMDGLGGASVRKPKVVNKLTALVEAAKAASVTDHNENPRWYKYSDLIRDVIFYPKNARFIAACDPATILELCALLEKMEEVIAHHIKKRQLDDDHELCVALAAIKQWKEQT
jgi:hypothetical protein